MKWNDMVEKALRKPSILNGSKHPRPFMVDLFAVYLGCHFDPPSEENPNGRPHWHISLSMFLNAGYKVREWSPVHHREAVALAKNALGNIGEGAIFGAASYDGVAMHFQKYLSGREITMAMVHKKRKMN